MRPSGQTHFFNRFDHVPRCERNVFIPDRVRDAASSPDMDVVAVVYGGAPSALVPANHKDTLFAIGAHPPHKTS